MIKTVGLAVCPIDRRGVNRDQPPSKAARRRSPRRERSQRELQFGISMASAVQRLMKDFGLGE
ncbi:hypothetical protein [uncultured Thiohalocapsa sp.]|uniref:hypothetical protein n=1 Tax=uncultured Thiohalocapsa sp. TaxID=768990 RepID=UPI0025CFB752|nr:hypothetical protein [uncultured Thiohalocapsa sp.]